MLLQRGKTYSYSKVQHLPCFSWNKYLQALVILFNELYGLKLNSVLCNRYVDGKSSLGWHSDNEPILGPKPTIATLTLGAGRQFHLRHKTNLQKKQILLEHGSVLFMSGNTQSLWEHSVPRNNQSAGRINLSFREIL